ncbi:MAG: hypothetical protein ABH837_02555, partial [bacterium]
MAKDVSILFIKHMIFLKKTQKIKVFLTILTVGSLFIFSSASASTGICVYNEIQVDSGVGAAKCRLLKDASEIMGA